VGEALSRLATRVTALSIIVPVLNEGATIAAQLAALQPLRAAGAEIVLVDGGSGDGTADLARALVNRLIVAPRGRAVQMNAGARASRGEVLLFLHADTILPAAAVALVLHAIDGGAQWGRFDVRIDGRHPLLRVVERMMNCRSRLSGVATGDQAMFVRREVFERIGGFPEIPLMEDIALSTQLRKIARPACLREPVTTSGRRWEKHGVWRTILLMWRLRAAYFFGADPQQLAIRYGYAPQGKAPMAIAVFSKAPRAGETKTRLIPALGAAAAARLQRRLCLHTLDLACRAAHGKVTLWAAPDHRQRFFRAVQAQYGIELRSQTGSDLGERMANAFAAHAGPLLLIGTDCPALTEAHLAAAAAALHDGHDAVFIPAEDGGYVLVGLRRPQPRLFEGIAWGSDKVMAQTRERLVALGLRWAEPLVLWDVDRPEYLPRLAKLEGFAQ
jgi:rSAM/selenodomain-associated transferase 2/rSAM/selenodomain-associated transferase 1